MSRPIQPPHLSRKRTPSGGIVWIIRDGTHRESTGLNQSERASAEKCLARYIDDKYAPPRDVTAANLFIDEIIAVYLKDYAAYSSSREFLLYTARPIARWWRSEEAHV